MNVKPRWRLSAPLAAVALVGAMMLPGTSVAATPQTWHVAVGAQTSDQGRQTNFFYNRDITVNVGDTVQWASTVGEIHTVTFLAGTEPPPLFTPTPPPSFGIIPNPAALFPSGGPSFNGSTPANSGVLPSFIDGHRDFSLTFGKAGDYAYVCLVHATMNGVVHVQQAGTAYPKTQAQYDSQSSILQAQRLGAATALQAQGLAAAVSSSRTADSVGIGQLFSTGSLAVLRFLPDHKVIHARDTVTWSNLDPETPHTITFGTEPASPFAAFAPTGTDGTGLAKSGHATITSTSQSVNSGFVGTGLPFGKTFSATFTEPGTYTYICALHDPFGMDGTITVLP